MKAFCLGMHRSGTSLLTRLINLMGGYLGDERDLMLHQPDNPRGFWENQRVTEFNDHLLAQTGSTWDRPERFALHKVPEADRLGLHDRAAEILRPYELQHSWLVKDPRLCVTLPFWLELVPDPVVVHAVRHPLRVALSLFRRGRMPLQYGLALWEYYTTAALANTRGLPCLYVEFQSLAKNRDQEMARIREFLQGHGASVAAPDEKAVTAFLNYAPRRIASPPDILLSPAQKELWRELLNAATNGKAPAQRPASFVAVSTLRAGSREHRAAQRRIEEARAAQTKALAAQQQSLRAEANAAQALALDAQATVHAQVLAERETLWEERQAKALAEQHQSLRAEAEALLASTCARLRNEQAQTVAAKEQELTALFLDRRGEIDYEHRRQLDILERNVTKQNTFIRDLLSQNIAAQHVRAALRMEMEQARGKAQEAIVMLRGQLEEAWAQLAATPIAEEFRCEELQGLKSENKTLRDTLASLKDLSRQTEAQSDKDLWVLQNWLEQCFEMTKEISKSLSWRLGNSLLSIVSLILMRNPANAFTQLDILHENFQAWRRCNPSARLRLSRERAEVTLSALILSALDSPLAAMRQLSWERLINFGKTLLSKDEESRHRIFLHYTRMFAEDRQEAEQVVMEGSTLSEGAHVVPYLDSPEVSVIIPVCNQWDFTNMCIRSILETSPTVSYEVLLADDCSTDDTAKAAELFPGLVVVRNEKNLGFLRNCNNAASKARGRFLVFLNNDTVVKPGWLESLHRLMVEDERIAISGSKLIFPDGTLQEAGGIIWDDASGWNYGRLADPEAPTYNYVKDVDYISGASIMVRRDFWDRVGGFDDIYAPAYFEDADLAFKARELGLRVVYQPLSVVVHFEGKSHGTDLASGIKHYQVRNMETFKKRWAPVLQAEHFPNGQNVFQARDRSRARRTFLVIDHYVPHFDQDAGSRATFLYLSLLAKVGYNVKFLGENFHRAEPYTTILQQLGIEVFYGNEMAQGWREWMKTNRQYIDVVCLNRPHIAEKFIGICREILSAQLLYCCHDLHFLRKEREYELSRKAEDLEEAKRWEKLEERVFRTADVVLTFSSVELEILKTRFPDVASSHIPLYALDVLPPEPDKFKDKSGLFYVGGFGHPPNLDSMLWFLDEIFPMVLKRHPNTVFWCAGSKMPKSLLSRDSQSVRMLGALSEEDLARQLEQRRVNVVPLRYGAGVKGKVVEALANGMLLVATGVALEGLPGVEECVAPCDTASSFADEICRLLVLDEKSCARASAKNRDYAWRHFSQLAAAQALARGVRHNEPLEQFLADQKTLAARG